ncbi:hypothetical protein MUY27_01250 [Mucilaginibacter sp. RS28]|uniref:Uncharacterized protein n=1 Tax=Mucilaginibacter straminoryzae TaxID=2932774 RepID=A0A9X1WZC7_9SPHI|nr:hypothetical protein [Mucilaginibacter straminoryzae]MCJ8208314.1 hypothetical protein [Mucilaginibacter straminoryzae]
MALNRNRLSLHVRTLLLTALFLLVKINPRYFAWQTTITPGRTAIVAERSVKAHSSSTEAHVFVDKAIAEFTEVLVPDMKFTGLLLSLFACIFYFFAIRPKLFPYIFSARLSSRLATLCVRRL